MDLSGDMDLSIPYPDSIASENDYIAALLGGPIDEFPDRFRDFSPIAFVDSATAPFLILQGLEDEFGLLEHSRRMAKALQAAGVEVIHGEFAGLGHLDTATWELMGPYIQAFLDTHLHPPI